MRTLRQLLLGALIAAGPATAEEPPVDASALEQELQSLKEEVLALNRDLILLREDMLFPANQQMAIYVSLDVGELFELESVQLRLNDQVVANHLYTPPERAALARGGVHQLWLGNVPSGKHELVAFFTGVGPNGRDYRRAADLKVEKGFGPKSLELRISDLQRKLQPEFVVREWQ